ncbi:hypothetical protein F4553_007044 [Allocatelliglobosispora scoriae]|uniref:DUF4153 domain-containing protein n=1 Tax=Allocatelliglobosispora scoriae TaxID=643052 RepID=A0A841C3R8_9ACTN|nr:permease prefix domain 1-containing protein [Allocatelliglobosispora scoriae]MBB5873610.1 hypothetical protein [Allocatelliglobosispora scoriae]
MTDDVVEGQIAQWRAFVQRRRELQQPDADELEDHLRSTIAELIEAGLRPDEAFLVAVKRMGGLDELSREFAREHSDRLWKQLVLAGDTGRSKSGWLGWLPMVVCAGIAAIAVKVPSLFGVDFDDDFWTRNFALFGLIPLAAFFAWTRRMKPLGIGVLVLLFTLGAVGANVFAQDARGTEDFSVEGLTAVHLPLALWLVVGFAYVGGEWLSAQRRMDFIRFTGEAFIYFVLIGLGGGVLTGITYATFQAIGVDVDPFVTKWLVPCGMVAAVVVAGWLVEAKQSVVENMAPVLTRLFTPLFTVVLIALVVAFTISKGGIDVTRDVLILFNVVLIVVLGLILYSISARDPMAKPGIFDRLQLALVISALVIDVLVLIAVYGRTGDAFGYTPNRVAALGLNVILFANLAWSAVLLGGFLGGKSPFRRLERWQTDYLLVYAGWAWIVVFAFPPIFGYA